MKKQFYEKALPRQGVYCAAGIRSGKVVHRFAESIDALIEQTDKLKKDNYNVYVAPSTFEGHSRKTEDAVWSRSFFVDLDVNHGAICYESKDQALEALGAFVTDTGLPPPVRIDSGTGIQAYWLFEDDIAISEWHPYAEKFKDYCIQRGLKIDPAVTADAARIMRCPDTYNYKTDPPNLTFVMDDPEQYDFGVFKEFLGEIEIAKPLEDILAVLPKGLDKDTAAFRDDYEFIFEDIAVKSLEGSGCAQIKYIIENAATLQEPMWYAGLSVAVRCVDGAEAIHMLSEDHPSYSKKETEKKAQQSLTNATWAHSCLKFDAQNPGVCDGCQFKGRLRSGSPIDIGKRLKEAPTAEEVAQTNSVRTDEDSQEVPAFPEYMKPFVRGRNGGVFHMPPPDENGERDEPVCLTASDLFPLKRVVSKSEGVCLVMKHILPKDPVKEFLMPIKHLYSFDMMKKILGEYDVIFHVSLAQRMFEYLSKWDVYLRTKEQAEIMRDQMGWTEDKDAFVIGNKEITRSGDIRITAASPMVRNISKLVRQEGSYELWKQSAQALDQPGFELHALGLLQGFGSPLMHLTSTPGASICYQSTDSGVGKSGALYAGLSVFCDPYNISVLEGNATENAHIGRYLGLKNMLFGIDEASNIEPEILSKILHRISQGKAKLRMQSSANAERDLELSASLQGGFTSNQSLYDKLFRLKNSPQGELARLIEFQMKRPTQMDSDPTLGIKIFNPFRQNYGWAGPEYIKYLYAVGDAYISKVIDKWMIAFAKDYGGSSEYRFYMNTIATCFAGGELAAEAGIIKLNLDRIYLTVIQNMIQIRDKTVKAGIVDYKGLLTDFFYKNIHSFLFLNEDKVVTEPRNALMGRVESSTQRVYISKTEFKKFLSEKQVSSREFEVTLEKEGILIGSEKKRLSSGWKAGTGATPPIMVYAFASILDVPATNE